MENMNIVEEYYKKIVTNISNWIPEGVIEVDLNVLEHFDLLRFHNKEGSDPNLTRYFHIFESQEKITLINEQFVIWIVPEKYQDSSVTYTLIALNQALGPKLEMAISHSGVYNTSRFVLKVLEKALMEIQETEDVLSLFKKSA